MLSRIVLGMGAALFVGACNNTDLVLDPGSGPTVEIDIDFDTDRAWSGGQADYSTETAPTDVVFQQGAALPSPFDGTGLYSAGTNRSDDLFLYAKKKYVGLNPSSLYRLAFELRILTDVPSGCVGVGGSPGESVTVKAGASAIEPMTVETAGEFRMNIDKGEQTQSGDDGLAIGDLANARTDCADGGFELKTLRSTAPLEVETDADGALWLFFGIDSGFEAGSELYYVDATVAATPL
ncbi:MAG TPA: hypothetical protein VGE51_11990 [Fontimonas sp.]